MRVFESVSKYFWMAPVGGPVLKGWPYIQQIFGSNAANYALVIHMPSPCNDRLTPLSCKKISEKRDI